jgi:hypothetical protein
MKAGLALLSLMLGLVGTSGAEARVHVRQYLQQPLPDASPYTPGEDFPSLPSGFTMTVTRLVGGDDEPDRDQNRDRSDRPLNTGRDVADQLSACWTPPPLPGKDASVETTLRLSFTRAGAVIGTPRITYARTSGGVDAASALRRSILDGVAGCAPLRFTQGLGSAIAGVPFTIRFIARRAASSH